MGLRQNFLTQVGSGQPALVLENLPKNTLQGKDGSAPYSLLGSGQGPSLGRTAPKLMGLTMTPIELDKLI